jgi:hypothetical protein
MQVNIGKLGGVCHLKTASMITYFHAKRWLHAIETGCKQLEKEPERRKPNSWNECLQLTIKTAPTRILVGFPLLMFSSRATRCQARLL